MSAESDSHQVEQEPTRALLLAQALETCIQAEREVPGSADRIIAQQPAWARAELRRLIGLAGSLDAAATSAVMSDVFRVSARARLMRRITAGQLLAHAEPIQNRTNGHALEGGARLTRLHAPAVAPGGHRRRSRWLRRGIVGGLLAVALAIAATLTASASALPGEPLYRVKQAREAIGLRLAPDDQARAFLLLNQADTRLSETERLLQEGRTDQAAQTTQRFDDAVDKATTTYVVTITASTAPDATTATVESELAEQQDQLKTMLATAPEPARPDLREALVATVRGRAMVADPKVADESPPARASAAPVSTPTPAPVATDVPHVSPPPPVDRIANAPAVDAHADDVHDSRDVGAQPANVGVQPTVTNVHNGNGVDTRGGGRQPTTSRRTGRGPGASDQQANSVADAAPQPIPSTDQATAADSNDDHNDASSDHTSTPAAQSPAVVLVAPTRAPSDVQASSDDRARGMQQPAQGPLAHTPAPPPDTHSDANGSTSVVVAKPTVTPVSSDTRTTHDAGADRTSPTATPSSDDHHTVAPTSGSARPSGGFSSSGTGGSPSSGGGGFSSSASSTPSSSGGGSSSDHGGSFSSSGSGGFSSSGSGGGSSSSGRSGR